MAKTPNGSDVPDRLIQRLREGVAAALAVIITLFTLSVSALAFTLIGNEVEFSRSKDVLLVLTPFFGLALGYYFNKVSTEGRAESAEASARTATAEVQGATAARADAEAQARGAEKRAHDLGSVLGSLVTRAKKVISRAPSRSGIKLAGAESDETRDDDIEALRQAIERAERLLP